MNTVPPYDLARQRVMPMITVVVLHVLLLAALTVGWKRDALLEPPIPIQAMVIQESTPTESPLPLPTAAAPSRPKHG